MRFTMMDSGLETKLVPAGRLNDNDLFTISDEIYQVRKSQETASTTHKRVTVYNMTKAEDDSISESALVVPLSGLLVLTPKSVDEYKQEVGMPWK